MQTWGIAHGAAATGGCEHCSEIVTTHCGDAQHDYEASCDTCAGQCACSRDGVAFAKVVTWDGSCHKANVRLVAEQCASQ
jgi:hypothetical protein